MATYNYLPGVLINTIDGGLDAAFSPTAKSTLIVGTSGAGPVNQPTQVTNPASAAATFGLSGNLIQAMEEVLTYSDNVILFRMGTSPQTLAGVGAITTGGSQTLGFTVTFGQNSATANTDYSVWYNAGAIVIWYKGNVVYSNSSVFGLVDTGDISLSVSNTSAFTGLELGINAAPSLANSISIQAASQLAATSPNMAPTLTAAVTGLGLTGRQTFIAWREASELLTGLQIDQIYVPSATVNAYNVAHYVSSDATTVNNNPVTNPDALDWLKTIPGTTDSAAIFQWAHDTVDSSGNAVAAMTAVTPATRIAAGFHEVNWGYDLAAFAASVSGISDTCIAVIGARPPASFKLVDVRKWIGMLPTYASDGVTPTAYGLGLLGISYLVGTTSSKMNSLCADFVNGFRLPGFYQNEVNIFGEYDGGADLDLNQNPVDIGAYLHVVGDQAIITNSFATNYVSNVAGIAAGYLAQLDEKSALTNKALTVTQIPGLVYTPGQLDALTQAKVNMLRPSYVSSGVRNPSLLHDYSAANSSSDYIFILRTRIKGLVIDTMLNRARTYIGTSSLDGLQMQSLQTALDKDLVNLQTRGYISGATVTINSTVAQQKIGHANLYLKFTPANELVQLTAFVGITQ